MSGLSSLREQDELLARNPGGARDSLRCWVTLKRNL